MPPKAPKAKPRPIPRPGSGARAPDAVSSPAAAAAPPTNAAEVIQTHAPIAPPPGRLDSLIPSNVRSSGVPVPLKFKPRAVPRKTKEEREALDAKFEVIPPPATRPRGGISSRGPRGRGGRGGGFGGRDDRQVTAGASGPFALGSITTGRSQKIAVERGNFGKYRHRFYEKTKLGRGGSGEASSSTKVEKVEESPADDFGYYSSSSADSEGPRMDVEYISLLDNAKSEDEGDGEVEAIWGAGAPIRVLRRAHIDRATQVNTESSSLKRWRSDLSRKGKEAFFEESVKVKDEPVEDDDDAILSDVSLLPEFAIKEFPELLPPVPKKGPPRKPRRRSSSRRKKVAISSAEDKEELEREELDRATTLKELARGSPDSRVDSEGDVEMDDMNAETENQIFIFQFPNIFPQLLPAINTEKEDEDNRDDAITEPPGTEEKNNPPNILKLPQKYKQHKLSTKAQQALLESYPPPGLAGKLRVHKSGRMSILWGVPSHTDEHSPVEMDVTRGTSCEFLQEAVVIKQQSPWGDQDIDERGRRKGAVFSLGQVKGKFVVSPDFEKLLDGDKKKKGKGGASRKTKGKDMEEL